MAIITHPEHWPVDNQEVRMRKGPLVRVQKAPGQYVKMYEADAIRLGLLQEKSKPAGGDKMRKPERNKAVEPETTDQPADPPKPDDDFTIIPGVGAATARALAAHGITTFEQLDDAVHRQGADSLDFLPDKTVDAIDLYFQQEAE